MLFLNRVNLQQVPIPNQPLVVDTHILTAFYLTTTKSVRFTHYSMFSAML